MKRYFFLMLLLISSTLAMMAQTNDESFDSVNDEQLSLSSDNVLRNGNTYFYTGQSMNKREYRDFLSTRCTPAYELFNKGYRLANAGWGLFGSGLAIEVAGVGMICAAFIQGNSNTNGDLSTGLGNVAGMSFMFAFGTIVCATGGILEVASIPMLCVGYSRMHNSVDVYNIEVHKQPALSLGVSSSTNGVGLALRF